MSKRRAHRTNHPHGHLRSRPLLDGPPPLGLDPSFQTILSQIDERNFAWSNLAENVLPIFERARPFSHEAVPPIHAVVPPGVTVGFGVDVGPAFLRIAVGHLAAWPVDLAGLAAQAVKNLERRTRRARPTDVVRETLGGVPALVFQSQEGWASTTVLVPGAMDRLFGQRPALFVAPARDLLIGLPPDVDLEFATWLTEWLEATNADGLHLEAFEWRDGTVSCRPLRRDAIAV